MVLQSQAIIQLPVFQKFWQQTIINNEGGGEFHRNKGEKSGTRWGIYGYANNLTDAQLKAMTEEEAMDFYILRYWDPGKVGALTRPAAAVKYADILVHVGVTRGVRILQEAINGLVVDDIPEDGVMGTQTILAANRILDKKLHEALRRAQVRFYQHLLEANPQKYARFAEGWLTRARTG